MAWPNCIHKTQTFSKYNNITPEKNPNIEGNAILKKNNVKKERNKMPL